MHPEREVIEGKFDIIDRNLRFLMHANNGCHWHSDHIRVIFGILLGYCRNS